MENSGSKLEKKVRKLRSVNSLRENIYHCMPFVRPHNKNDKENHRSRSPAQLRRILTSEMELCSLLELASSSDILCAPEASFLERHLPPRSMGFPWKMLYSTTTLGFSLNSLYRSMKGVEEPVLLIIEDMKSRVFGAYLSRGFYITDKFFGDRDTFLFRFHPKFEVFKWSGRNFFFMQGKETFISVGADNGKFGIWLDDSLDIGRSDQCATFFSPPLVEEKDFKVRTLECWCVDK